MRHIAKSVDPPQSIRDWLVEQLPVGQNLNYRNFNDKPALRRELIAEQFGLCAYTGTPIDERLAGYHDANHVFQAHIEHVKPRRVCKDELVARGGVYGRDLCEDMDHRNLVAALEVKRQPPAKSETFGAAAHGDEMLPVTPLQAGCEEKFRFDANGAIFGVDHHARETIQLLNLRHATLSGWRRGAIAGFFPNDLELTRAELEQLIERLDQPTDSRLPEFSFCIRSYARSLLASATTQESQSDSVEWDATF
ncbi:MAG: hypothetical protein NT069_34480 [Planctomycetota bacterium]|nr:hypothetical protein [Planctomycetota bacterium]